MIFQVENHTSYLRSLPRISVLVSSYILLELSDLLWSVFLTVFFLRSLSLSIPVLLPVVYTFACVILHPALAGIFPVHIFLCPYNSARLCQVILRLLLLLHIPLAA